MKALKGERVPISDEGGVGKKGQKRASQSQDGRVT